MNSGTISDSGEMKGQPLMFYLSGKDMVMRLLVDHVLRVMDIMKAALLRLRIIKLRLQYSGKM